MLDETKRPQKTFEASRPLPKAAGGWPGQSFPTPIKKREIFRARPRGVFSVHKKAGVLRVHKRAVELRPGEFCQSKKGGHFLGFRTLQNLTSEAGDILAAHVDKC